MLPSCLLAGGCTGIQSALDPAGSEASDVATLFWVMAVGGAVIWAIVVGLLVYASRTRRRIYSELAAGRLILLGGVAFPVTVLAFLLGYAFWTMPGLRPLPDPAAASTALRIEVTGEQFWWRVSYRRGEAGALVAAANEIRLPVGERVEFVLESSDVIHSFWIPSLGGKMDMIPGRTNRLSLQATKAGVFRGPCAEYCGTSHALMAFTAVAMPPADFEVWLAQKAVPSSGVAAPGQAAFLGNGCGACHTVLGTDARGVIGPDLSHIGSRETLGAGILPNTEATLARFIARPDAFKPGSKMPAYAMLPDEELRSIAAWLKGLR